MASGDGPVVDLAQLQKTFKMVENDRARYAEESQNIIKRQRQAIEKIRKENERLKEQLESETRSRGENNSTQVHLARLYSIHLCS
jgi:cell shape-determining protein MreC